jgi:hypothetical protein
MKFAPEFFAPVQRSEYDELFGDPQPAAPRTPEQAQLDDAYLLFASAQGKQVLDDLIMRYLAAPIFDSARDAAKGYERNGEANVVRNIIARMERAMRARADRQ